MLYSGRCQEFSQAVRRTTSVPRKKRFQHAIHLRFTIYDLQIMRSGAAETAKQMRTHICKAVIGRSYKGAEGARWQTGAAHVRCTRYDVRFGNLASLWLAENGRRLRDQPPAGLHHSLYASKTVATAVIMMMALKGSQHTLMIRKICATRTLLINRKS